jgi:hypothetical protein
VVKGKQVNIPASGFTDIYGNVSELGDVSRCPGKSSLFFLTVANGPGIRLSGDRARGPVKHLAFLGVRSVAADP